MSRLLLAAACAACLMAADAPFWKVTPQPPSSIERDRAADLAARRKAVAAQIGDTGILVLYAAEPRNYAGDVDWPYRQENDFFYLTGIAQAGNALVIVPGAAKMREILFVAPSNPEQEDWTGHILTHDEARRISGIQEVWDARQLDAFLSALIPEAKDAFRQPARRDLPPPFAVDLHAEFAGPIDRLYLLTKGGPAEYRREQALAAKLEADAPGLKIEDASQMFSGLRRVKSAREVEILKHAVEITAEGFQRAYALGVPGTTEHEIQAQFEFTFLRRNAHWGYPCIVASGANATTLHYESNGSTMQAGDLLLLDDAAEYQGYSADVTRTIPVSGKYSRIQADIYRLVWQAQKAGIDAARPGKTPADVTAAAMQVFRQGLYKLGLITEPDNDRQVRVWFNHGISHGIGLNVHDPGAPELQPGMAITVEPGLYFRPDALENLPQTEENEKFTAAVRPAFEKYKGIGVRIEDDVLITTGAPQVLSAAIPSKLEEVEAAVAQLRKTAKSTPLP